MNKFFVLLLLLSFSLFSQETEMYKAIVTNDSIKGFKSIELTPEIKSIATDDLSDVRILDSEQQQVPYFLAETKYSMTENFIPVDYQITYKKKYTRIVISNNDPSSKTGIKTYNSFTFQIANADVNKVCKIEGSDHGKRWFVVSEKLHLTFNNNSNEAYNYYTIHFPKINYSHIRLVINDSISAPINIKNVGVFNRTTTKTTPVYKALDYTTKITNDKNKTQIHVTASRAFEINQIAFTINAPELYQRDVTLYTIQTKNKKEVKRVLTSFKLNSENKNRFKNLNFKHTDFWISIANKDNQPLDIKSISFYQKTNYLVAVLQANKKYIIAAGNKKLQKPSYDLVNFKDKIKSDLPIVKITKEQFYYKNKTTKQDKEFYEKPWFMWLSIGLVALLILFFTMSLIKEAKS